MLTFLKWRLFVFLESLYCYCFKSNSSGRILFQHIPHILLAENKQITVAHRTNTCCSSITFCVNWKSSFFFQGKRERKITTLLLVERQWKLTLERAESGIKSKNERKWLKSRKFEGRNEKKMLSMQIRERI